MPKKTKAQLEQEIQGALASDRGGKITSVAVIQDSDTGKARAHVTWSNRSTTVGDVDNLHIKALLARARREGVRIHRDAKKAGKAKPALRIAYRLHLTPGEMQAVEFARGRYEWADMLSKHAAEDGSVAFTEPEMWQWTDDVDGDDAPFSLASPELAEKLQRFYDERV